MPHPASTVPIRIGDHDVGAILSRVGSHQRDGTGAPTIQDLFNVDNKAVQNHIARHGPLGGTFVYCGGGLRLQVFKVNVQPLAGSATLAGQWRGVFERAYEAPVRVPVRLYGKAPMPPLPPGEVAMKRALLARGSPGAYLQDHLDGSDVKQYLLRMLGDYTVSDPGCGAPLVWQGGAFISLVRMYGFLKCAFTHRRKSGRVLGVEAALAHCRPRQYGVECYAEYAELLSEHLPTLQQFYHSRARRQEKEWARAKHDSMFSQILAKLAPKPQSIVVVGGNFQSAPARRGWKAGTPLLRSLLTYLERHRIVIYIDEFYSSAKCAAQGCGAFLQQVSPREKWCGTCKKTVNRDDNAQQNLVAVFEAWLHGRPRPNHLQRPRAAAPAGPRRTA